MKGRNVPSGAKLTYEWKVDTFELIYKSFPNDALAMLNTQVKSTSSSSSDELIKPQQDSSNDDADPIFEGEDSF